MSVPSPSVSPSAAAVRRRRLWAGAGTLALSLTTLAGCGLFPSASAVTYDLEILDDAPAESFTEVEYTGRQTGLSTPDTTEERLTPEELPARFETLGQTDDTLSIAAEGIPDQLLRCAITVDGSDQLDQQESAAPGEGVTCSATLPTTD
ncbi:hypothetical protein M3B43_06645 [Nesterenkonia massiliensis]|uniref:Uncharacterized protein n=1 Tax=Nesterenkonia massiliensis TaxID=1232429 RepID=A0ABT2HR56_9MICC|nr:hypothetical protein [Nesterenkonia massiliensis]MCT1607010.1 hypothetical protein [Nesterenkonia massiliensis]